MFLLLQVFFYLYVLFSKKISLDPGCVQLSFFLSLCVLVSIFLAGLPASLPAVAQLLLIIWCVPILQYLITAFSPQRILIIVLAVLTLHAQWGIVHFVIQDDLRMYRLGETQLDQHQAGVAKFQSGAVTDNRKVIRAYGPYAHANSLAGSLVVGMCLLLMTGTSLPPKVLAAIILTLTLGLLVTFSRAAWVAAGIALLIYFLMDLPPRKMQQRQKGRVVLIMCLATLVCIPLLLSRTDDPQDRAVTERKRGALWAVELLREYDGRGVGIGNYQMALQKLLANKEAYEPWEIAPVHSVPLLLVAEWGMLPALAAGVAVGRALKRRLRSATTWYLLCLLPVLLLDHYLITQVAVGLWVVALCLLATQQAPPASRLSSQ